MKCISYVEEEITYYNNLLGDVILLGVILLSIVLVNAVVLSVVVLNKVMLGVIQRSFSFLVCYSPNGHSSY